MDTPNTPAKTTQPSTIVTVVLAITSSQGITDEMKGQSPWLRILVAGLVGGLAAGLYTWMFKWFNRKRE